MHEQQTVWSYPNINKDKWEKVKNICRDKYNFDVFGDSGITQFLKVKVQYQYSPTSQTAIITLIDKPFIFPLSIIKEKMDEVFAELA